MGEADGRVCTTICRSAYVKDNAAKLIALSLMQLLRQHPVLGHAILAMDSNEQADLYRGLQIAVEKEMEE